MARLRVGIVRQPIHLNRQTGRRTIEIENVRPDRVLTAKAQAREPPFTQSLPKHDLRQAQSAAQLACAAEGSVRRPHAPMPPPPCCAWSPSPATRRRSPSYHGPDPPPRAGEVASNASRRGRAAMRAPRRLHRRHRRGDADCIFDRPARPLSSDRREAGPRRSGGCAAHDAVRIATFVRHYSASCERRRREPSPDLHLIKQVGREGHCNTIA